jgi:hypothetical protein
MNWSMMAIVVLMSLFLLVASSMGPSTPNAATADVFNTMRTMMGLMCFAGLAGGLITPARAFEIDTRSREVRILSLYALGTRRRVFKAQDIDGFIADPVRHNGPEAYWMYLALTSGRKVKLSPMAGRPEIAQNVHALLASLMSSGTALPSVQPRKGFGRAA